MFRKYVGAVAIWAVMVGGGIGTAALSARDSHRSTAEIVVTCPNVGACHTSK